ncbi:MAG: NYN domain-containing protein [Coriobacteriia bacterium]|nr:NYN domain-containing protein [Coriobacteriia bacterium]
MHHLIIDGYNVIRQVSPYRELAERNEYAQARDALIGDVAPLATKTTTVTVVFDGTNNPTSTGAAKSHLDVTVIYSRHGQTADSVIEKLSHTYRKKGETVEVVTSDATIQWTVMSSSVMRRSTREFGEELRGDAAEWQRDHEAQHAASTLDDRLSPESLAALNKFTSDCR